MTGILDADGVYLVTPSQLVQSMARQGAIMGWIGASIRMWGVVLHVGDADEARVRRLNDGQPFIVIADSKPADQRQNVPVAVCELDAESRVAVREGDPVVVEGEVWGTAGPYAVDLHCASVAHQ